MVLNYENKITILYNGGCHNTYIETKRGDRNDEQTKLDKETVKQVYVGYKFCDSSRLFIPWGSSAPAFWFF